MTTEKTENQEDKQVGKPPAKDKKDVSPTVPVQPARAAAAEREQLIYIGPNLPGGRLAKYFISLGGFPAYLSDISDKVPAITELFVPVADLSAARVAMDQPGTTQNIAYAAVVAAIQKGVI
ncbi:hypothetical protein [Paenibacillus terrae]|uniref:Uncharacterized protein n=1 Tax=Paenibacillus terrae TaxID=159743 RepID=A0A0D7X423_9BACL|nr:hypothetical protein [Paenibacillus terrae]KJD45984.1 hypothetical protein QD47_08330 [Paenibacillus terrae]